MPERLHLTDKILEGLEPPARGKRRVWDSKLPGFGAYVTPSGARGFFVSYRRADGRERRMTLDRRGGLSTSKAREEAALILTRVRSGEDPLAERQAPRRAANLLDLWPIYSGQAQWGARTRSENERLWRAHLSPQSWARVPLDSISAMEVVAWHSKGRATPGQTNLCWRLLRAMLNFAMDAEMMRGPNPVRKVRPHRLQKRERFLSPGEYCRLFTALDEMEAERDSLPGGGIRAQTAGLFRLLALTGCRLGEWLAARWDWVEFEGGVLVLPAEVTKTGQGRRVALSPEAVAELRRLHGIRTDDGFVVEGQVPGKPMGHPHAAWRRVCKRARLSEVRIHDLRHSYASLGIAEGYSLPIVGKGLGHQSSATTAIYAHLAEGGDPVRRLANAVGAAISAARQGGAKVVEVEATEG